MICFNSYSCNCWNNFLSFTPPSPSCIVSQYFMSSVDWIRTGSACLCLPRQGVRRHRRRTARACSLAGSSWFERKTREMQRFLRKCRISLHHWSNYSTSISWCLQTNEVNWNLRLWSQNIFTIRIRLQLRCTPEPAPGLNSWTPQILSYPHLN